MNHTAHLSQTEYDRLKAYIVEKVTRQSDGNANWGESYQREIEAWIEQIYATTDVELSEHLRKKLFF